MNLIFMDTEFTGLHKDTTLVSIGLVSDDFKTFYAEFTDYDKTQVDEWLKENVINKLTIKEDLTPNQIGFVEEYEGCIRIKSNKIQIKEYLLKWISQFDEVQLISDCCHYDMVLFVDIFGSAWELPKNVCPSCHDINQDIAEYYDITEREAFDIDRSDMFTNIDTQGKGKHNSLADACDICRIYRTIENSKKLS